MFRVSLFVWGCHPTVLAVTSARPSHCSIPSRHQCCAQASRLCKICACIHDK
ncbi:hypothetical protein PF002_g26077 [Phytophthora fragariae]|uniref:RxLR effector protein n=1 Tax=Phytophthora fragariae TaxID=53985 RepID=A0A6A3S0I6_9STRA|nr:hypothetical protein PF003_g12372 [Phytophthora fragariae]KAE8905044.1 hypothetical protein PF003_g11499 [Phytophthora fragariae]KAE8935818.1 hypothetical protein PF009_g14248 [Phytophthora fragariae]KAE9005457.1 hypothetical protein PF011_g12025 [Phytophthora fragariae]KAE9107566.1 hypothetical protein PF007_g12991 [Phytophthora fragariae]